MLIKNFKFWLYDKLMPRYTDYVMTGHSPLDYEERQGWSIKLFGRVYYKWLDEL